MKTKCIDYIVAVIWYLFWKIIQVNSSALIDLENKIEEIVLTERTETMIPLLYLTLTLMAFYGPNAEILGNIKLNIWHHQSQIFDIETFVWNLLILFFVDILSFVANGLLVWKYCNVNVLAVLLKIQKSFWFFMANCEALLLMLVSMKCHNFISETQIWQITIFYLRILKSSQLVVEMILLLNLIGYTEIILMK